MKRIFAALAAAARIAFASQVVLPVMAGEEWHVKGYGIKWDGQYDIDSVPETHTDEPGCTFVFIDVLSEISYGDLVWSEISKTWVKGYADYVIDSYGLGIPYTIYRDGVAIATGVTAYGLDGSIWFTDYDAVPGKSYNYEVRVRKEDVADFLGDRTLTPEFAGVFDNAEDFTSGAHPFSCYFTYTAAVGTNEVAFARDGGERNVGLAIYKETASGSIRESRPPVSVYTDEEWLWPRFETTDWQCKKIIISADENNTGSAREGVITILYPTGCGEGFKWQIRVTQAGSVYTVRYRKYDGSGETAEEDFERGKTYRLAWMDSQLGWMRSGYEFCGWVPWNPDTKARLCKYDNGQPVRNLADAGETVNLYCGWKSSSSYRVCFHRCAGPDDLLKMNQVILRNKEDSLAWMDSMIGWKRDGYTFAGWDESEKATTVKYANGAKVKNLAMNGGTKHLYAVWRANADHKYPYKVKFYKYDGSGETRTQSFKAGTVQSLLWMDSQLGWSRPGYEFVGWVPWNPDKKPRLCKYVNGQKVVDLASKSGEVVSLYPAWKSSSSYRVCFNRNDGTGVKMNQVILRNKEDNLAWMDSMIGWKREGYVFKGWAESANGAVKYANGAKVTNLAMDGGTKHLYAIWRLAD